MTESQGHLTAQPYSDKSAIPFGLMEDQYKDLLENKDLRKISSGDFTGVGDKVKEMFSVISNDRVPEASKTIDHIVDANKMIGEFERVMISASKMYGSLVNTLLLDLANAHLLDIAAKDERVAVLEQITQHPLYEHLVKAEARITELEAQVQELIEELIEELQDVVCFAPECTTSKEYAVKRLEELMNNKWEAK